jgi:hypothetical protein
VAEPIPGIDVVLSGEFVFRSKTNDKGIATFRAVTPGSYLISAKGVAAKAFDKRGGGPVQVSVQRATTRKEGKPGVIYISVRLG